MRYIKKSEAPDYFTKEVEELELEFNTDKKRREIFDSLKCKKELHLYMLKKEQNGLCGYCESKIEIIENSHIEHIEPIKEDNNLIFDYQNLIVSCDGVCHSKSERLTCGHKKDTKGFKPNYSLFLSPTKVKNIRDYFIYTSNFFIGSSSLDKSRATETLRVLNLNSPDNFLQEAREKALKGFEELVKNRVLHTKQNKRKIIKFLLEKENLAFISFLRCKYQKVLNAS